jgi:hypothetical protein
MCELVVTSKAGPDVLAESIEQGLLLSKANLTFRWGVLLLCLGVCGRGVCVCTHVDVWGSACCEHVQANSDKQACTCIDREGAWVHASSLTSSC